MKTWAAGVRILVAIGVIVTLMSQLSVRGMAAEDVEIVKVSGTLEPTAVVCVSSQVSGTLMKFGEVPNTPGKTIDYGTEVKKGTVLAQIDPTSYRLELDRAKANVDKAEAGVRLATAKIALTKLALENAAKNAAVKTGTDLDEEHAKAAVDIADAELADKKADLNLAKTELDRAQLSVTNCTIKSPVDGIIIARRCDLGQVVAPRADALSLFLIAEDWKKLQLWLSVSERDIGKVAVDQPVRFSVPAFPNERFTGRIAQIRLNAQSDHNEVFYTVVANLDHVDEQLLPYLTGDAEIVVARRSADR